MNIAPVTEQRLPDRSGCWRTTPVPRYPGRLGGRGARDRYPRLTRLVGAPTVEPGVWSVSCFYIHRRHRRVGVAAALLAAAVDYARAHGAGAVEGYPVDTAGARRPSGDLFTGTAGLFAAAGFRVHSRPPTGKRIVVRLSL
jgi:GNAT superfamily N-acetyltransferase